MKIKRKETKKERKKNKKKRKINIGYTEIADIIYKFFLNTLLIKLVLQIYKISYQINSDLIRDLSPNHQ
ncbi:hypothetical protein RhiirA4_489199 [Rhizophagus irregularis]|uniref:Uncharacterized protein n=1 Tax=Rhizophagus irregularis TaxID=588596 RepID=A0A2I1HUK9_9GLOM|nr:hypothetical protein RhiirA4_489199 [Rhizophagus irregularis]